MSENVKLLSYGMVSSALSSDAFYKAMPEFLPMKPKVVSMQGDINNHKGCSGCKRRRIIANLFKEFLYIVSALNAAAINRLKSYYKVDKIMVNKVNKATGAVSFESL